MSEQAQKNISVPQIESNVDLSGMNTMGVQARAKIFVNIEYKEQLKGLYDINFFENHDPLVLGGGSNLLMVGNPEQPVLKMSIRGIRYEKQQNGTILLTAGAGENWHNIVHQTVEKGFGGVENLALIPGTMGAAPIQNIGAYGVELEDCFENLTAFHIQSGTFRRFEKDDCRFGYRDSIFKNELKGKYIICDVSLRLTETAHRLETGYRALSDHLKEKEIQDPGIGDIFEAVVEIRRSKLPDPADAGNAGSFFKNPVVTAERYRELAQNHPEMPSYELESGEYKLPAAWFIDRAGWKGKRVGNVGSYKNQALVLVNHGGASGREIYDHAMRIRDSVNEKFGIDLNPEVNIIGDLS